MESIAPLLEWLARSELARVMATSAPARETAATLHALGAMVVVGAALPLNLRLLGLWRGVPLADLNRVLSPLILLGFLMAVASGVALAALRPFALLGMPAVQAKLALIALLMINALALRLVPAWRMLDQVDSRGTISRFRTAGLISLLAWSGVLALARWPALL